MEARIARIEADVAHLRTDVADIKVDLRTFRDKMDARLERMETKFDAKFDSVKTEIASAKTWALLLYVALAASTFGTLARAFGWICLAATSRAPPSS